MKTINVYRFEELSEAMQRRTWTNSNIDFSDDYSDEYRETLHEFEKVFDIRIRDYDVTAGYFRYTMNGRAADAPDGDSLRVARYVWNNFAPGIMKGKFYSTRGEWIDGKYSYKHRHSKIILEMDNCPLTGYGVDCDILQPVIDCLHYKKRFTSYDALMKECLQAFFHAWYAEMEYCSTFEYFQEWALANDENWYTENGDIVKGAA